MSEPSTTPAPKQSASSPKGLLSRYWWLVGLAIAGVIAILASNFASRDPDGLNSVANQQGFASAGATPGLEVLPGYTIPGLNGTASTIVAALVGIVIVFGLVFLLGRLLARRRKDRAS